MNKGKDKISVRQQSGERLLDRDLSWMFFNYRILQEAQKENLPLLERLSFLGIYSNNLDEFFRELMVSPNSMKSRIIKLIDHEAKNARAGREAWMKIKINHVTEPDVMSHIYAAAQAGVKIQMLVRGNCSIVP